MIQLLTDDGEQLKLAPPFSTEIEGWQWVGGEVAIGNEYHGRTLRVELTVMNSGEDDIEGKVFFDDICITFEC